jgi:CO/xanthine dehydrogenase Mo-binding subunit
MYYGIGNTGQANPSSAFVEVLNDGTAIVSVGAVDIGQGSSTVLAQIAAETLGLRLEDVALVSGDTAVSPEAGATSASRQTYISGQAVRMAADAARKVLLQEAAEVLEASEDDIAAANGYYYCVELPERRVPVSQLAARCRAKGKLAVGSGYYNPPTTPLDPETGQGAPYATYAFGTQIAEVEVDTETGEVTVVKLYAANDVGRAINPQAIEGQIEGGIAQGVGQAIMEYVVVQGGRVVTPSLSEYILPTAVDAPEVVPIIVEDPEPTGPFGAKGVGEPAMIPTPAAVLNAIADAIGVYLDELPATPERVLRALRRSSKSANL